MNSQVHFLTALIRWSFHEAQKPIFRGCFGEKKI